MQVWQMAENIYNDEESETPANELEWYKMLRTFFRMPWNNIFTDLYRSQI